ncbi:protein of unknown function [Ruminococcaceae bacterium BL-6]|nr:protein of unknown function [Ruminococcaceae bacterium BL-6]
MRLVPNFFVRYNRKYLAELEVENDF